VHFRPQTLLPLLCLVFPAVLLAVLAPDVVFGQGQRGQPRGPQTFSLYARSVLESDREPAIRITTNVPYSNLIFKKADGHYESAYRVYVEILDHKGKKTVQTSVINESVSAPTYPATKSDKHNSKATKRFVVAPGDYVVRATVQVKGTHIAYTRQEPVTVPDFFESGLALSTPQPVVAKPVELRSEAIQIADARNFDPLLQLKESSTFTDLVREPAFKFDLFLSQVPDTPVAGMIYYEVLDADENQVHYGRKPIAMDDRSEEFIVYVNSAYWQPGKYDLRVKAVLGKDHENLESLEFHVDFTRVMLAERLEDTLEILELIGDKEEVDAIRNSQDEMRIMLWESFWEKRDPTPGTPTNELLDEYFRRVRFASASFGQAGPGWKSDRGKVFIRHGEPDEVSHRQDAYMEGQYLIWKYHDEGLTFVFYDRFGLGEYTLTQSSDAF